MAFYEATITGGAWAAGGLDIWIGRLEHTGLVTDAQARVAENGRDVELSFQSDTNPLGAAAILYSVVGEEEFTAGLADAYTRPIPFTSGES